MNYDPNDYPYGFDPVLWEIEEEKESPSLEWLKIKLSAP